MQVGIAFIQFGKAQILITIDQHLKYSSLQPNRAIPVCTGVYSEVEKVQLQSSIILINQKSVITDWSMKLLRSILINLCR